MSYVVYVWKTPANPPDNLDVLVIGAGPTGLTLACQLVRWGVRFRIVDKQSDRARESRALGVQARSLEVFQSIGLGEVLAGRGRTTTRLALHVDRARPVAIDLGNLGRTDTRFPYILFVSQADTEGVLTEHLESRGVTVERRVEFVTFREDPSGVSCILRHADDREESVRVRYLIGCDGAHSSVRKGAKVPFEGGAYLQNFALGDVEADGALVPGAINAFALGRGVAIFFPLGHPSTWRVMAMEGGSPQHSTLDSSDDISTHHLSLPELQGMVDDPTHGAVHLRDPGWLTRFRLHHRQAARYRQGSIFLAGDAAHIHSPVGAQGMNTGIQDAWNLGWKLAMVSRGLANERILESYHAERWPVGHTLLRATDRLFGAFARSVSGGPFITSLRRLLVRHVVAPALSRGRVRATAFHFVSQLGIRYRGSPAVTEGEPQLRHGPMAGDRLPDARVRREGHATYLQEELCQSRVMLLLCGSVGAWNNDQLRALVLEFQDLLGLTHLSRKNEGGALIDEEGEAFARLGVASTAQYVIRPDGHVGFRCAGTDLSGAADYLRRWFKPAIPHGPATS